MVFLTARSPDEEQAAQGGLGPVDFVGKPFEPGDLVETDPQAGRGAARVVIEERLLELIRAALETAAAGLGFDGELPEPELLPTKKKEHGDFATNVALVLASRAGKNPREVAEAIRVAFPDAPFVETRRGRGAGVPERLRHRRVAVRRAPRRRGEGRVVRAGAPNGQRVQVEFVSANPTGPLHVGPCPQRGARRCHRSAARARGLDRRARVLLQRCRRPDGPVRRVRRGALPNPLRDRDARSPRTATTARTSMTLALELKEEVGTAYVDMPHEERLPLVRHAAAERVLRWIDAHARALRRGLRHLHVRGVARGASARSTRRSNGCAERATSTRRTERCGSAPRRSGTTRIAS